MFIESVALESDHRLFSVNSYGLYSLGALLKNGPWYIDYSERKILTSIVVHIAVHNRLDLVLKDFSVEAGNFGDIQWKAKESPR